jgi:bifunctional DNA-binding transcriptional regulator/antitoxin component of YhaV-PrlF toxin-antitoxin module
MSRSVTITVTDEIKRILPPRVRRTAGFKAGDQLEVRAIGGVVTLISKPPMTATDEYTPEQRRAIKAEIVEARKGPYHGPFKSGDEFAEYFKAYKRRRTPAKSQKSR